MKLSDSPFFSNRILVRDLIGLLLVLVIGIGGQIFILNPIGVLAPNIPLLSPQDWTGSRISSGVADSSGSHVRQWKLKRIFGIGLQVGQYSALNTGAEISQAIIWYAESAEAIAAWQKRDTGQPGGFFNTQPVMTTHLQDGMPESILFCTKYTASGFKCAYFAYSGHWYTNVWFWSGGSTYLSMADVQNITTRINQLLLKAPDKP